MDRRLFIAVPLTSEIKRAIEQSCLALSKSRSFSRFVHPEDYHITLFFLGATKEETVRSITQALNETMHSISPFDLTVTGTGTFGRPASPSIFWAGVEGELDRLSKLQQGVTEVVQRFGFTPEDRPYRPHITLARKWQGVEAFDARRFDMPLPPLRMKVTRIVLYETHMNRKPSYEEIASFALSSM